MKFLITILILFNMSGYAQNNKKIIYKYRKYQEFDLETLGVDGQIDDSDSLSSDSSFQQNFKNRLPLKRNFNSEIRHSIEGIR